MGMEPIVLPLLDAVDADVIALAAAHVHMDAVAHLRAHDGAAHRRFLADKALQGVLPQGGDQLDLPAPAQVLHKNLHRVVQPRRVGGGAVLNDVGGPDHPLEIADAGVVAVFVLLGAFVLEILAEVAEGPRRLHVLDQFGTQHLHTVVDLLLHLLYVAAGQFIIHGHVPPISPPDVPAPGAVFPVPRRSSSPPAHGAARRRDRCNTPTA